MRCSSRGESQGLVALSLSLNNEETNLISGKKITLKGLVMMST